MNKKTDLTFAQNGVKCKTAFTLAEVLITLGIIGVVAAMTIPTLIANTRSQKYRNQFKKTLSTLNQSVRMSQAQYDLDFSNLETGAYTCTTENDNPENAKTICAIFNGTLTGSWNMEYTSPTGDIYLGNTYSGVSAGFVYDLNDGSSVIFPYSYSAGKGNDCSVQAYGYGCPGLIDVDGPNSGKNEEVSCSSGSIKRITDADYAPCVVNNSDITDVFPIVFHDATIEPATNAAAYVLHTAK